jgi:hypothetical protein
MTKRTRKINGFTRVSNLTAAKTVGIERARSTRVGWATCDACNKLVQTSGLGVGSHRRACDATQRALAIELAARVASKP